MRETKEQLIERLTMRLKTRQGYHLKESVLCENLRKKSMRQIKEALAAFDATPKKITPITHYYDCVWNEGKVGLEKKPISSLSR